MDYDIESYPLYIKTDNELGNKDRIRVHFQNVNGERLGGVLIEMTSSPTYYPIDCRLSGNWLSFLTDLPSAADKVWRIMVTKNSEIRLLVHCNDVKVVDLLISESTCEKEDYVNWGQTIKKIKFHKYDTASDFYSSSPPLSKPITPGIY